MITSNNQCCDLQGTCAALSVTPKSLKTHPKINIHLRDPRPMPRLRHYPSSHVTHPKVSLRTKSFSAPQFRKGLSKGPNAQLYPKVALGVASWRMAIHNRNEVGPRVQCIIEFAKWVLQPLMMTNTRKGTEDAWTEPLILSRLSLKRKITWG